MSAQKDEQAPEQSPGGSSSPLDSPQSKRFGPETTACRIKIPQPKLDMSGPTSSMIIKPSTNVTSSEKGSAGPQAEPRFFPSDAPPKLGSKEGRRSMHVSQQLMKEHHHHVEGGIED